MKREGRQHGMVRSYRILPSPLNPRPGSGPVNRFDSPPTAGLFTKVPSKPTNHSKFTGKCGRPQCVGCHMHPACKSKEKTKGTQKVKSSDIVTNHKLISWRVVNGRPGLKFSGFSATGILDHLSSDYVDDYDFEVHDFVHKAYDYDDKDGPYDGLISNFQSDPRGEEIEGGVEIREIIDEISDYGDGEDDDNTSFCDVGIVLNQVDADEGWCLVEEM